MRKIILASASPRRKKILQITGLKFTVCRSNYEENFNTRLKPRAFARMISRKKAEAVAHKYMNAVIIAADTFIVFKNRLLGKPGNGKEAEMMLRILNGRSHSVITGLTIIDTCSSKILSRSVETRVHLKKLAVRELRSYVNSGEPLGKAGAYAIQGLGAVFIKKIEGDFYNVMGLPLSALTEALKRFGIYILQ